MSEQQGTDQSPQLTAYCIQCDTGYELYTSSLIEELFRDVKAYAVVQEKHQSKAGVKSIVRMNLLPGYVFLYSHKSPPFREILPLHHVYRFLSYGDFEEYGLRGTDLDFAMWVLRHEGLLTSSKAVQIGSKVHIVQGPLSDAVGTIEKVDRHNRNVCLSISFDGNMKRVWMPFEWTDDTEGFKTSPLDTNNACQGGEI
jgi:transcription antitermination factor NusG